jgi:hypothetical protein
MTIHDGILTLRGAMAAESVRERASRKRREEARTWRENLARPENAGGSRRKNRLPPEWVRLISPSALNGVLAQLVERLNGIKTGAPFLSFPESSGVRKRL